MTKIIRKLYSVDLNGKKVYMVREENNTIGHLFNTLRDAYDFIKGEASLAFAVAVNQEAMQYGRGIGFLKKVKEIKQNG